MTFRNKFFIFESNLDLNSFKCLLKKVYELDGNNYFVDESKINQTQKEIIQINSQKLIKKYKNTSFEDGTIYFIGMNKRYTKSIGITEDHSINFSNLITETFNNDSKEFFKLEIVENGTSIDSSVSIYGCFIHKRNSKIVIFYTNDPSKNINSIFIDDFVNYLLNSSSPALIKLDLNKKQSLDFFKWIKNNISSDIFILNDRKFELPIIEVKLKSEVTERDLNNSSLLLKIPYNKIELLDLISEKYLTEIKNAKLSTLNLLFQEYQKKGNNSENIFYFPISVFNKKEYLAISMSGSNIDNVIFRNIFINLFSFIEVQ